MEMSESLELALQALNDMSIEKVAQNDGEGYKKACLAYAKIKSIKYTN